MTIPRFRIGSIWLPVLILTTLASPIASGRSIFFDTPAKLNTSRSHVSQHLSTLTPGFSQVNGIGLDEIVPATRLGFPVLNPSGSVSSALSSATALNHVNGEAAESMMHRYYSKQGWKSFDRLGSQGIDGLFYRIEPNGRLRVLIAESKFGSSKLGKTLTKGHQMSHEWILKSIDEQLKKLETQLLKATAQDGVKLAGDIDVLRRIRKYVEFRDYRSELFRANVKNGVLEFYFDRLEQTRGGEAPTVDRSKAKSRKISLKTREGLTKSERQVYDSYFEDKKRSLLKKLDDKSAQQLIDELKAEYTRNPMGSKEERLFLQPRVEAFQAQKIEAALLRRGDRLVQRLPVGMRVTALRAVERGAGVVGKAYASGGRLLPRGLVVLDVATNTYFTFGDFGRWKSGEIGGEYFGFKAGLRSVQSGLTIYAIASPDATFVTKIATGTAAALLMVADVVSDPIYDAASERRRELLSQVDKNARMEICRMKLVESFEVQMSLVGSTI